MLAIADNCLTIILAVMACVVGIRCIAQLLADFAGADLD